MTRPFLGLGFLLLAIGYSFLQGPVMAIEVPEIAQSLGTSQHVVNLAATIMIALSGATLIAFGRAADQHGRRRMCLYGIVVVLVASVLSALAWDGTILVLGRALQGLGTAMLLTSIGLVSVLFDGHPRKDLAFGLLASSVGVGLALAPFVAAGALALGSWRLSFWLTVPVLIVAYIGIRLTVPESKDEEGTSGMDLPGTLLLVYVVLAGLVIVSQGQHYGWITATEAAAEDLSWPFAISPILVLLTVTVVAAVAFVWLEARRSARSLPVLVERDLFRDRRFGFGIAASFLLVLGGYALQFTVPEFGRIVLLQDVLQVAVLTAMMGVGIVVGGLVAAPLGSRSGGRFAVIAGLAIAAATLTLLVVALGRDLGNVEFATILFVFGIGYGLAYAQVTEVIMEGVPRTRVGLASGMMVAGRTVAMAIGSAAMTAIMLGSRTSATTASADMSASRVAFAFGAVILLGGLATAFAIPRDGEKTVSTAVTGKEPT
jgi:MFS family permease